MADGPALPLDHLLERLRAGDPTATEEIFRACEAYLRRVIRRQMVPAMRAKLDSVDVVQSVWVQVLREFQQASEHIRDGEHLLAYLTRAARNRLVDRIRQHRAALEVEVRLPGSDQACDPPATDPRPSQLAQAAETWYQIQTLCSPAHAAVVDLRRQGLTVDEIAVQTEMHPSSVRRILYDLARRLGVQRQQTP